jgi:predicted membrane chloride channel (bestrophin family)
VEARHVWDNVMNRSRDIVRTAVAYEPVIGTPRARRIVDLTCAFGVVLEEYACQRTRARELEILLRPSDLAALELASNRPLAVIELLSEEIIGYGASSRDARNSMEYQRLLGFLDELGHQVGQGGRLVVMMVVVVLTVYSVCCPQVTQVERLLKAPIPAAYYGHALRFLTVWVFTLPLALLDKLPMPALVPATGFVTWALFGLVRDRLSSPLPSRSQLSIFFAPCGVWSSKSARARHQGHVPLPDRRGGHAGALAGVGVGCEDDLRGGQGCA